MTNYQWYVRPSAATERAVIKKTQNSAPEDKTPWSNDLPGSGSLLS